MYHCSCPLPLELIDAVIEQLFLLVEREEGDFRQGGGARGPVDESRPRQGTSSSGHLSILLISTRYHDRYRARVWSTITLPTWTSVVYLGAFLSRLMRQKAREESGEGIHGSGPFISTLCPVRHLVWAVPPPLKGRTLYYGTEIIGPKGRRDPYDSDEEAPPWPGGPISSETTVSILCTMLRHTLERVIIEEGSSLWSHGSKGGVGSPSSSLSSLGVPVTFRQRVGQTTRT